MVLLRVADDGLGFDPAGVAKGRGVRNVTRARSGVGGSILMRARPGGGCIVECLLPLPRIDDAGCRG